MLYESFEDMERSAAGNTCVSMGKMRNMIPKTLQNDWFSLNSFEFSGSPRMT